jgi:hypothetical protein
LAGTLPGARHFEQAVLDEAIAVVSNVRNTLYEIIDIAGVVKISGAHLREDINNLVADLLPVLPNLLIDLLLLLLLHTITLLLRVLFRSLAESTMTHRVDVDQPLAPKPSFSYGEPTWVIFSPLHCRAQRRGFVPRRR